MRHTLQHPLGLAHLLIAALAIVTGGFVVASFSVIAIGIWLMFRHIPRLV